MMTKKQPEPPAREEVGDDAYLRWHVERGLTAPAGTYYIPARKVTAEQQAAHDAWLEAGRPVV